MKTKQNSNRVYFKIYALMALIIILIALIMVFNKTGQEGSSGVADTDEVEIIVREATSKDSQTEKNNQEQSTDFQNLGPATVEELGGSIGHGNIESLLEGKEIEIGE